MWQGELAAAAESRAKIEDELQNAEQSQQGLGYRTVREQEQQSAAISSGQLGAFQIKETLKWIGHILLCTRVWLEVAIDNTYTAVPSTKTRTSRQHGRDPCRRSFTQSVIPTREVKLLFQLSQMPCPAVYMELIIYKKKWVITTRT